MEFVVKKGKGLEFETEALVVPLYEEEKHYRPVWSCWTKK